MTSQPCRQLCSQRRRTRGDKDAEAQQAVREAGARMHAVPQLLLRAQAVVHWLTRNLWDKQKSLTAQNLSPDLELLLPACPDLPAFSAA